VTLFNRGAKIVLLEGNLDGAFKGANWQAVQTSLAKRA